LRKGIHVDSWVGRVEHWLGVMFLM
jgi:hypothetical protein